MSPQELQELRRKTAGDLKNIRVNSGVSIVQLSIRSGLSTRTIYRMEGGKYSFNYDCYLLYTKALDQKS